MRCSVRTWLSSPAIVLDAAMFACDEARRYRCASVSAVSQLRRHVGHCPTQAGTCQRTKPAFSGVSRTRAADGDRVGWCSGPSIRPSAGARRETLRWRLAPLPARLCKQRASRHARASVKGGGTSKTAIVQDLRRRLYKREHKGESLEGEKIVGGGIRTHCPVARMLPR